MQFKNWISKNDISIINDISPRKEEESILISKLDSESKLCRFYVYINYRSSSSVVFIARDRLINLERCKK